MFISLTLKRVTLSIYSVSNNLTPTTFSVGAGLDLGARRPLIWHSITVVSNLVAVSKPSHMIKKYCSLVTEPDMSYVSMP